MLKNSAFYLPFEPGYRLFIILLILISASISEALGQSAVLFINRVKARRFFAAILSSAIIYIFNYFFWVVGIALVLRFLLKNQISDSYLIFYIVMLAYIPRLFGFLVFSPLIGSPLNTVLKIWGMLILQKALVLILNLTETQAVLIVLVGFFLTMIIRHSFGHPLIAWARALTKRVAGVDLEFDPDALSEELVQESYKIQKRRGQSDY